MTPTRITVGATVLAAAALLGGAALMSNGWENGTSRVADQDYGDIQPYGTEDHNGPNWEDNRDLDSVQDDYDWS